LNDAGNHIKIIRIMKFIAILLSITYLFVSKASAQSKEVKFLLDTSIALMKTNAVNRDKVDWGKLLKNVYSQIASKENAYQLGPVFRMLFKSLNDFHGAFYCWDSTYKWQRQEPEYSDSIKNEWKKGVFLQKDMVQGNIGYLRVPYISFTGRNELDKKAQSLNDSLCALLDQNVMGIILDFRLNGGGAMFPMMLGLEQLLHDGKIGSFTENSENWILKDNSFCLDTAILTSITPKCQTTNKDIPVAILIGPATGSSGEFLAIAFKKRKNTIFIGTETAGYVTATKGFKINDAVTLLLSTGYGRDREGQIYERALSPDIYINEPDSFNDIKNDKKVLNAVKWIKAQK
jgi:carboxyl-terminal processing protease